MIASAAATEGLATGVPDSGGVTIVPAFTGMGAPHWRSDVRGVITGITAATTPAHLARATLEAVAQQTADLMGALAADGVRRDFGCASTAAWWRTTGCASTSPTCSASRSSGRG